MSGISSLLGGIVYYAREKYYHHILTEVLELQKKYGLEPILVYWKAFSLVMTGQHLEGMRELDSLVTFDMRDIILCVSMLHIYAHKLCATVDKEAVQMLESRIRTERTTCGEQALYHAGMFMWLRSRHDKAREYIDRMLKLTPKSREGLTLRGWIDLTCGRDSLIKRSVKYFDDALDGSQHKRMSEALFGKSRFYLYRYDFGHAMDVVNQAVAGHEGFVPALIEKMKLQLAQQDWDQAVETAQRCLSINSSCIEAKRMLTLHMLARDGAYEQAADGIGELIQLLDQLEPKNHLLFCEISMAYARMAGGKNVVLQQTMTLVKRALSLAPQNSAYYCELAYQQYLSGQTSESLSTYKKGLQVDETSVQALSGMLLCQIVEGNVTEAQHQLEFLAEVQASEGKKADLLYLNGLVAQKRGKPVGDVMNLLNDAIDTHFMDVKGTFLGIKYFEVINPHFLLDVAKAMMQYAPTEPTTSQAHTATILKQAAATLDPITKSMPGMVSTTYQLARIKFLSGEMDVASELLQNCMKRDPNLMEAHLLMAQLHLMQDNIRQATASIEMALSSNFEVQNYPQYQLIKAMCERKSGELTGALKSLELAMNLVQKPVEVRKGFYRSVLPEMSMSEKVTLYLELGSVYSELGNSQESAKVIQDAVKEFKGTSEEHRIVIASADLALARGEVSESLSLLKDIKEDHPYFIQAKEKMASIYLKMRGDKKMYLACYEELASKLPGPPTSLILGDAYMYVQEPEKALAVYEASLKQNTRDSILASKVGQALIKTHHYNKAIIYYETALKDSSMQFLRLDLAELLMKLKQFEKAERTLKVVLDQEDTDDLEKLIERIKYISLMSKVYQNSGDSEGGLRILGSAYRLQTATIMNRVAVENPEKLATQTAVTVKMCCDLAGLSKQCGDPGSVIQFHHEALKRNPKYVDSHLELASIYLSTGQTDECNQHCITLLSIDHENEGAALIRSDLLYQNYSYDEAIEQLLKILERKPAHFEALRRVIELYWRSGTLDKVEDLLEAAKKACNHAIYEPGLNYCRGLYYCVIHEVSNSLRHFNMARRDSEWGERAIFQMVEICLNPDKDLFVGEVLKPSPADSGAESDNQMAIKTADKLLHEVKPQTARSQSKTDILECYVMMSTKSKPNIEKALEKLMTMASEKKNNVEVLLALAAAHMLLKQLPRARNQLKISSKLQWLAEDALTFEKTWLLLADIYIQSGKYDLAQDLLMKCLKYNKSCSKAWEYRGYISEKEQAYRDAAGFYEQAWKYSYHAYPTVGFKLAFNHLKAKWYVGAIDVCHQVLQKHPDYPKIRKEILQKARAAIRV